MENRISPKGDQDIKTDHTNNQVDTKNEKDVKYEDFQDTTLSFNEITLTSDKVRSTSEMNTNDSKVFGTEGKLGLTLNYIQILSVNIYIALLRIVTVK
jgi:hypothetical protein